VKSCKHCKWAEWRKTAAGRKHPSGEGRCTYVVRIPVIPKAFRWGYKINDKPDLNGGYIDRKSEWDEHCPVYAPVSPT
jgi:hypothetical protein